jgi:hypothetical protein
MPQISLFGWEFKRKEAQKEQLPSFTPQETNDGAVLISAGSGYGTYVDLDGTVRTEAELVTKYREMSLHPECDAAIDEIVNESVAIEDKNIVTINLENVKNISEKLANSIKEEFQNCLKLLDFSSHAYDIYRRWYIDGRLYFHVLIDKDHPHEGIKELRYVDPRKIRKIREISKQRTDSNHPGDAVVSKTVNEYYIFNDKGFNYGNKVVGPSTTGLKIAKDTILHIVSGLTDNQGTMVLSYLHKAIKCLNQLRTLEDALVIYRLSRAPERRIWYIDVGNLPKIKAEQYLRDIMVRHRNRLIYDAQSGEVKDDRKFMTMLEDYWLPRREGGKGTEVITLPGGQTLGQMDDVLYFQKKFLNALNVPISRLNSDALDMGGSATGITRDELKFQKFIIRLRIKFTILFTELLKKQLVLKGIMSLEEWDQIAMDIRFDYGKDNYFDELKKAEIAQNRINLANAFQSVAGKYYPHRWIRKEILQQTDDNIKDYDKEISREIKSNDPRWINPEILQNESMGDQLFNQKLADMHAQAMGEIPGQMDAQGQETGVTNNTPNKQPQQQPQQQQLQQQQPQQNIEEPIKQAIEFIKLMKEKGKANRTMQDEAKYKQAIQLVSQNKANPLH